MNTVDPVLPRVVAIAVLTAFFFWFGSLTSKPLAGGPLRIVSLELAPTEREANAFLTAWANAKPDWQDRLRRSLRWDTWFICAYAPLFALLCWVAADHFTQGSPRLAEFGRWLAGMQLLAGALDFVENWAMGRMIEDATAHEPWPQVSATASGIKWLLILGFTVFVLVALGHWAWTMLRGAR